jgi:hypothetical protein
VGQVRGPYLVYQVGYLADGAIRDVPLHSTHSLYRRRFGIETSYRLLGAAGGIPTSRSPAVRLLQIGVALLLQDECVILKLHWASEGRQGLSGFVAHEGLLPLATLLDLLCAGTGGASARSEKSRDGGVSPIA